MKAVSAEALEQRLAALAGADAVRPWREEAEAPEIPLVAPRELEVLAECLRLAARDGLSLVPLGLGSKTGWTRPAAGACFALSTRRFRGIISYEPGDGTLTARAGTTLAEIDGELARGGHRISPDVPAPGAATLGGVAAAGQSGFDRLRRGPLRNHVLGMRVVNADGRVTRSGGQLVKNVTGYDLHRLYCGSHGTLCLIAEVSLRLFPAPELELAAEWRAADRARALAWARALAAPPLEARTLLVAGDARADGACRLALFLSGRDEAVRSELGRALARMAELGAAEPQLREGPDAAAARVRERDRELEGGRWPELRVACLPSAAEAALQVSLEACAALGLEPAWTAHPGVATLALRLHPAKSPGALDPELARRLAERLAAALAPVPARARWLGAPRAARSAPELFGPEPRGLVLMRRLRETLDPDGVFARGRFAGGL